MEKRQGERRKCRFPGNLWSYSHIALGTHPDLEFMLHIRVLIGNLGTNEMGAAISGNPSSSRKQDARGQVQNLMMAPAMTMSRSSKLTAPSAPAPAAPESTVTSAS